MESMQYDVIVVGAGPAGLAAAIRIHQLSQYHQQPLRVCVLEKGAYPGAHALSGAILNPRSLKTLLPNTWQNAPLLCPVTRDQFYYLNATRAYRTPTPRPMRNNGNYLISINQLTQYLAEYATSIGCDVIPGFAAVDLLSNDSGHITGVISNPIGLDQSGQQTERFQPGMHLLAPYTLFAEGCRGELSEQLISRFNLRKHACPQTYALGIKELWQISPQHHSEGLAIHTIGWPLDQATYGGSFIYHLPQHQMAIGFVVGLDYTNPWLNPHAEMQRFKTHPLIKQQLNGGERIAYGARALNEGGWQSRPKLTFPGGALIGDAAGFLNVPQLKGIHTAMQSGILAAEAYWEQQHTVNDSKELHAYTLKIKQSWVERDLYRARNIRPGFRYGLLCGLLNAAFETYVTYGYSPWTLKNHADNLQLKPANQAPVINYPEPDGVITFDKLTSVYLSGTHHQDNQPAHLVLRCPETAIRINYQQYHSPEVRYCPAGVYELIPEDNTVRLQINAQNCLHCKTCDIKDPAQNIHWHAPEGGGGPNYTGM